MPVDVTTLSDEELEELAAEEDTPPPPDTLPGDAVRSSATEKAPSTGNPAIDMALGMGDTFAKSAMSLGEAFRDPRNPGLPGLLPSGDDFRKVGDMAARVFGFEDPGIEEAGTLPERISDTRDALPPAPDSTSSSVGQGMGSIVEALLPLLATGGGSGAASLLTRGRGFLPAAGEALKMGAKEAALTAGTSAIQEGDVDGTTGLAAGISGAVPVVGRGLTAAKHGATDILAKSLLTADTEAVKRGGSTARGLKESGVVASGVESLYKKLDDAAMKSTDKTLAFLKTRDATQAGSTLGARTFERKKIIDIVDEERQSIWKDPNLDTPLKDAAIKKLDGLKREFMGNRYVRKSGAKKGKLGYTPRRTVLSAEELIELRRGIGRVMNVTDEDPKSATKIINNARQSMYRRVNTLLEEQIPEIADLNKIDYDILTARDAAEQLLGQKQSSHMEFLFRRTVPLALAGGTAGYTAGGNPTSALGGLLGGAALGSAGGATALVQLLKSREGTRAAEIAARLFGLAPGALDDDEDEEEEE